MIEYKIEDKVIIRLDDNLEQEVKILQLDEESKTVTVDWCDRYTTHHMKNIFIDSILRKAS